MKLKELSINDSRRAFELSLDRSFTPSAILIQSSNSEDI